MNYQYFPIAPMDPVIWILTVVVLAIAPLFWFLGAIQGDSRIFFNVTGSAIAIGALLVFIFARPQGFEVTPEKLVIRWLFSERSIPRSTIVYTKTITSATFIKENGLAARIGVGGLFGGFGWLWTAKGGIWELYTTRTNGLVAIKLLKGKPLLITPANPKEFVAAINSHSI